MAKSNYRAPSEASKSNSKLRGGGVIELNKMSVIEAKLDALMSKINNQEIRNHSAYEVEIVVDVEKKNEEGLSHKGPL